MIRKGAAGSERNGQDVTLVEGKFKGRKARDENILVKTAGPTKKSSGLRGIHPAPAAGSHHMRVRASPQIWLLRSVSTTPKLDTGVPNVN